MTRLPPFIPPRPGVYLVGGCVRDLLLERTPTDWDVAVEGSPAAYAAVVAAVAGGRVVEIGKPGWRIWRVAARERIVDVSPIQGGSIQSDLLRRDFTINAMAMATETAGVLDIAGGREDLARRTIRMVSGSIFRSDPIRLVRTFRFAAQLGFEIENTTREAVQADAGLITRSAGERVHDEFWKLLGAEHHAAAVAGMAETGLLRASLPELGLGNPAAEPRAVRALRELDGLSAGMAGVAESDLIQWMRTVTGRRRLLLRLALLLHPLGSSGGRSARVAVFERLRCPKREREHLDRLLALQDGSMRMFATRSRRDEVRLFLAAGETVVDLLLAEAAWARSDPDPSARAAGFEEYIGGVLRRWCTDGRPRKAEPAPITGEDLVSELGLRPSPLFKELLQVVEEERLMRRAFTRADALRLMRRVLAQKTSSPPSNGEEL
jgi:tRNA nucleotidyltransferase/poly(A) polymerase